jgi:signal transduction histidine kinase
MELGRPGAAPLARGIIGLSSAYPPMQDARPRRRELALDSSTHPRARSLANRKVWFLGHAVVFACTSALLLFTAGYFATVVVMLSWGIGLAAHGFFAVMAPILRDRWAREEMARRAPAVTEERRRIEGRHARSLEQLSASIAHEIRNPITAARSLVAQMGEDPSSAENVEYARVALEELDRVERSITHLLRFARDEETAMRDVNVGELVDSAFETFRDRITKSGVTVTRAIDEGAPLRADPEKIRRVVINLIGNALDALESSGTKDPHVDIGAGENLAGTEVWLRVRDNGPGIAPEMADKLFTPFQTSKPTGTGLGLAISRKLVEAHGGTLEARPNAGGGAELTLTVPKRGRAP